MTVALRAVRVIGVAEVHIWMDTTHPPTGRVLTVEGGPAQPFVGWLQLLTVLANALQPPAAEPLTRPSEPGP